MKTIPTLKSNRLTLRPFTLNDAKTIQQLLGNKKVSDTALHIPYPYPDELAEQWISSHQKDFYDNKAIVWAIILTSTNELVGAIGLTLNMEFNKAEFGFWIGEQYWNKGYASEALGAVLKFGFVELKLNKIFAHHLLHNEASGKVMLKHGMQLEGHLREDVVKDGKYIDVKFYSILRSEYDKLNPVNRYP